MTLIVGTGMVVLVLARLRLAISVGILQCRVSV